MDSASDKGELKVKGALKQLDKRLKQMRREAREISKQAQSGFDVSSLRERLKDLKARSAEARVERHRLKRLVSQEATSTREQLLRRRENLRKNLENLDKTLSSKQAGKRRLLELREKYVKELQETERELQSLAAGR